MGKWGQRVAWRFCMGEKRSVIRFKPAIITEVEIVFEGAEKVVGGLRDVSQFSTFINVEAYLPDVSKCFLRIYIEEKEFYSRGNVIRKDEEGIVLGLENWFPVFSELARLDILSRQSTLEQILQHKKLRGVLKEAEDQHEKNRKPNCWEVLGCGKEFYCAAGKDTRFDGLLGGKNGGRFCAFVPDTMCKDGLPKDTEQKVKLCASCSFYNDILKEVLPD